MEKQERLEKQIKFILELDKIKSIIRQTYLANAIRKENDAEHSWHLAIMAIILEEYFDKDINLLKVIKMVLMHDVVEIDAGDTFCYDTKANQDKMIREKKAAERIYNILPENQAQEYKSLWYEFEEGQTKEAIFANVLDRLQPIMLNFETNGALWIENNISQQQVLNRNEKTLINGPKEISNYLITLLNKAVELGYLKK
ncbi:MAG: HD domain-containing protein [Firmicutes bacterium]|nr:HD domain-containing protein [Bacillota bacterium]